MLSRRHSVDVCPIFLPLLRWTVFPSTQVDMDHAFTSKHITSALVVGWRWLVCNTTHTLLVVDLFHAPHDSRLHPPSPRSTNGKHGLTPRRFSCPLIGGSTSGGADGATVSIVSFSRPTSRWKMRAMRRIHVLLALLWMFFAIHGPRGMAMDGRQAAEAMEENPEELLQWALNHSDTEALKKMAEDARLGKEDAVRRIQDIRETMEYLSKQVPSDAEEMRQFVEILENETLDVQTKTDALEGLQFLLESIDNANDFPKLGGVEALHSMLQEDDVKVRSHAAHALGIAAANNPKFQLTMIDRRPTILRTLMEMTKMEDRALHKKGLYALSALVRNVDEVQELFYAQGGLEFLETLVDDTSKGDQIQIRALQLFSDLLAQSGKKEHISEAMHSSSVNMVCPSIELLSRADVAKIDDILRVVHSIIEKNDKRMVLDSGNRCNAGEVVGKAYEKVAADAGKLRSMEYDHELREGAEEESGVQFLDDLAAQLRELAALFSFKGREQEL
mmetsp:Transcript_10496/g.64270  ORF Transcript_10496/g.64270 Transcript_10496/m.64270 type:complete len:503 (+) Transcript_10496:6519-8027(+)